MASPDKPSASLREPTLSPATTKPTSNTKPRISREELRERERKSRQRRVEKTAKMKTYVSDLEQMALALRLVPDADGVWDEYIDSDTKKLRGALRRMLRVVQEAKKLTNERVHLETSMADHKYTAMMLRHVMESAANVDDWTTKTLAWKELTRRHYEPWTRDRVKEFTRRAMMDMDQFERSCDATSSGLSFMGWYDSRRHVADSTVIHFSFNKKMRPGFTLDEHLAVGWRIFTEEAMYRSVIMGNRGEVSLDIVQRVTSTAWIVRVAEKHEEVEATIHKMLLLARVETDEGAVFCIRGFEDRAMQSAISSELDWWTASSTWVRYETLEPEKGRESTHYRMYMGGMCDVANAGFLPKWFAEILGIAIRAEAAGTGHWQLTF